jgi:hypothetical protein
MRRTRRLFASILSVALAGTLFTMPASAAPFETFAIEHAFPVDNPCTGQTTELSLTGVVHVREQLTDGGTFHLLERFDAAWTTADGFAGTARQVVTVTDRNPGAFDNYAVHLTLHFIGRDASGRVVQSRELFVVNLREGDAIVQREQLTARCSGRR